MKFRKMWKEFMSSGEPALLAKTTMKQYNDTLNTDIPITFPRTSLKAEDEQDPHGKNPHEPGAKLDAGKTAVWQGAIGYFPRAIEQVAAVSTFGARKYAWKGWESVPDGVNRYSDAMARHLIEEGCGNKIDHDSGLLIAAHTAWNSLARLELMIRESELG